MPPDGCPPATDGHRNHVVKPQRDNRGTAAWGATEDVAAVIAPREVAIPTLFSRMENAGTGPCQRVEGMGLRAFEAVAQPTRQAEVGVIVAAPFRSWVYMFQL